MTKLTAMDEFFLHQIPEPLPNVVTHHQHWRESLFFIVHPRDELGDCFILTMATFPAREEMDVLQLGHYGTTPTIGLLGCPNLPRDHAAPLDTADPGGSVYVVEEHGPVLEYGVDGDDATEVPQAGAGLDGELVVTISVESGHTRVDHVDELVRRLGDDVVAGDHEGII